MVRKHETLSADTFRIRFYSILQQSLTYKGSELPPHIVPASTAHRQWFLVYSCTRVRRHFIFCTIGRRVPSHILGLLSPGRWSCEGFFPQSIISNHGLNLKLLSVWVANKSNITGHLCRTNAFGLGFNVVSHSWWVWDGSLASLLLFFLFYWQLQYAACCLGQGM